MTTKHQVLAKKYIYHKYIYIINLITKDMIHIQQAFTTSDSLIIPVEIVVVTGLFWKLIGWQTIGGIIFAIILIAYQTALGKLFKLLQDRVARLTDKRLQLVYDVISGIRVLKMNAWEWCFRDLVYGVRRYVVNFFLWNASIFLVLINRGGGP